MNADRFSGPHQEAAKAYFLQCIDAATYERLRRKAGWDDHPYVAARLYLSSDEWKKYLWIGKHGSLEGFTDKT